LLKGLTLSVCQPMWPLSWMATAAGPSSAFSSFDIKRGDEISVSNFKFNVGGGVAPSALQGFMQEYGYIIDPVSSALKYIIAALVLFMLYSKVISPFAQRMMEVPVDEEPVKPREFVFDDDELENTHGKLSEMRKRVEQQLGISGPVNEDSLKYDVLLEKMKAQVEERGEEVANLLETLIADEIAAQYQAPHKKDIR